MSEPCNEVHARIIASEARTPPNEERRLTSLGGLRPNVAIDSAEALKTEGYLDLPVRENTVRSCRRHGTQFGYEAALKRSSTVASTEAASD